MSLDFAEEVMGLDLAPDHKHFARVLAIKQSIAQGVLTVTARVSAGTLRKASDDGLADLLARLNAGDAALNDDEPEIDPLS